MSRSLSRKEKGSHNRKKAKLKLAKLHARIRCIRQDALHQLTTDLTKRFKHIGIEDLNVKGMLKNRKLSRSIVDMGFFEFKRQLQYKAQWYGADDILADRWFPSSKLCSSCGQKNEALTLSIRKWVCQNCHTQHDRDVNAAINLAIHAVSSTVSACGEESAGCDPRIAVKLASVKQEVNTNNYL